MNDDLLEMLATLMNNDPTGGIRDRLWDFYIAESSNTP